MHARTQLLLTFKRNKINQMFKLTLYFLFVYNLQESLHTNHKPFLTQLAYNIARILIYHQVPTIQMFGRFKNCNLDTKLITIDRLDSRFVNLQLVTWTQVHLKDTNMCKQDLLFH